MIAGSHERFARVSQRIRYADIDEDSLRLAESVLFPQSPIPDSD